MLVACDKFVSCKSAFTMPVISVGHYKLAAKSFLKSWFCKCSAASKEPCYLCTNCGCFFFAFLDRFSVHGN